jgi:biopolymer transport protein ExbB/TolQ
MGPYKIPMMLISLVVLLLIIYSIILKFRKEESSKAILPDYLNAMIVIGSFNFALGMIGQITGIWAAINEIKMAGDINPDIVMTGILVSFGTTIYGLITFMVASLAWLAMTYLPVKR